GPDHLDAVVVRQSQVDDQQIRLVTLRLDDRALRVFGLDDAEPLRREQHPQHITDRGLVFDDEHLVHRLCHDAGAFVGSVNSKRAPPAGLAPAEMAPPCTWTIARQIDRPRPTPAMTPSSLPRWNLSNSRDGLPPGNPGPASSSVTRRKSPSGVAVRRACVP